MSLLKRLRKIYDEEKKQEMDGGKLNYRDYVKKCGVPKKGEWDTQKNKKAIKCKRAKKVVQPKVKNEGMSYKEYVKLMGGVPKKGEWKEYQKEYQRLMDTEKLEKDIIEGQIAEIYEKANKAPLLPMKPKKIMKLLYQEPVQEIYEPEEFEERYDEPEEYEPDVYEEMDDIINEINKISAKERKQKMDDEIALKRMADLGIFRDDEDENLSLLVGDGLVGGSYKDYVSMYGVKNGSKMWRKLKGSGLVGGCCPMSKCKCGNGFVGGMMKKTASKKSKINGGALVGGNVAQICRKATKDDLKNILMMYDDQLTAYDVPRPQLPPIYQESSAPPPPPPMKEEKQVSKEVLEYRKKEAEKLKGQQEQASRAQAMQEELKAKLAKRREEYGSGLVGGKMNRKNAPKKGSLEAKEKMAYLRSLKK
jgi:hypothetical protein